MGIRVGLRGEAAVVVDTKNTALALGSGDVPVLATSALVAIMERAAVNALHRYLDEGQETISVATDIQHLARTPVGKRVRADAEVTSVDGDRIIFGVHAFDALEKVGEGTHERRIINREDFIWKMANKDSS